MSKMLLMLALTTLGVGGCLVASPFWGVAVYYLFAVLRPQSLWAWEYMIPDVAWSFYVALAAMITTVIWRLGILLTPHRQTGPRLPKLNAGHATMFLFAVWITVTYYTAYSQSVAAKFYDEYQKIFIMYFVAALVITSVRQLWTIYLIVTVTLCYIAWEINDMYFFQGGYMYVYKQGYAGLDSNGAALMLSMGVPLALFAWDGIRHWIRWAFLAFIPLIIHAVLTSYSRGAMLSLIVSAPIYFIRARHKKELSIIFLGIGLMIPILAGKEIQERFFSIEKSEEDASAQSRLTTWGIAWQMALERPIFGYGVRNSTLFTHAYGADIEGRAIHSQYLQIAADSGLIGMLAYLLMLAALMRCLHRVRHRQNQHLGVADALLGVGGFFFLRRWARPNNAGRDDPEMERAYTIANGIEGAMLVFCLGGVFLSLETFELPYILCLMGVQLWAVLRLAETAPAMIPSPAPAPAFASLARPRLSA
jgi:probable O-glycosylation ligase (exosortase A-associated)